MQHVRHALSVAIIAAVLVTGAAACGSTPKPTASSDPLAGLTAGQITERAIADLREATSVRLTGGGTDSGKAFGVAVALVRDRGCKGSISLDGRKLRLINVGKSVWMLPSDSFYKSQGVSATAISLLSGKWLKVRGSALNGLSSFCSLSTVVREMKGQYAKMTKGKVTTIDGQRAVTIHQAGYTGAFYISDTAKPEILKGDVTKGSTTGTITFTDYGVITPINPPPARKVLDGRKLGF